MDNILRTAVSSGLKFPINTKYDIGIIPDNTFGVFVGIERSKKHELNAWPNNVHGCIGYWDPNYQVLDKKMIINEIIDVAYKATWEDNRKDYFRHTIYVDLYAKYKVYFMLSPIIEIDIESGLLKNTNEIFDNQKYGLIVENKSNNSQRATYLPNVFPNSNWDYIKNSLLEKASVNEKQNVVFYAYNCLVYSMPIINYFLVPIQNFINTKYNTFVPYMVVGNNVIIDKSEDIRNLGSIYTILKLHKYGYRVNEDVIVSITNNIEYYKEKYLRNKQKMRQASAFLMLDTYLINPSDPAVNLIREELYSQLNLQDKIDRGTHVPNFIPIDKDFENGEILMALIEIGDNSSILSRELGKVSSDKNANSDSKIFKYNWHSKLVKKMANKTYGYWLVDKITEYINNSNAIETNYYAVEIESLLTLYSAIADKQTRLNIETYIPDLLIKLENRKNSNGLYEFTDSTMRFDITGHVLDGFFALIPIFKQYSK